MFQKILAALGIKTVAKSSFDTLEYDARLNSTLSRGNGSESKVPLGKRVKSRRRKNKAARKSRQKNRS